MIVFILNIRLRLDIFKQSKADLNSVLFFSSLVALFTLEEN